jgi:hypothetical protein
MKYKFHFEHNGDSSVGIDPQFAELTIDLHEDVTNHELSETGFALSKTLAEVWDHQVTFYFEKEGV